MSSLNDLLPSDHSGRLPTRFTPCVSYNSCLDWLVFLREDRSYRCEHVDRHVSVLWHPHENRVIGVKIEGGRRLFDRVWASTVQAPTPVRRLPLASLLRMALDVGDDAVEVGDADAGRRRASLYEHALMVVGGEIVDVRRLS